MMAFANSGCAMRVVGSDGTPQWRIGRLQSIVSVAMGLEAEGRFDFFQVNWFKLVEQDPRFTDLMAVKINRVRGGAFEEEEAWVLAKRIESQVFFSPDPARPGWHHVHFKHSSSYQIPNVGAEE